jgi:hypothetical protein
MLSPAMTVTTGLRQWAGNNSLAIAPVRHRRLPSHASDRRRSWSMAPGVQLVVTRAYSAWHNGSGGGAAHPTPAPAPAPTPGSVTRCPHPRQPRRAVGQRPASGGIDHQPADHVVQVGHESDRHGAA